MSRVGELGEIKNFQQYRNVLYTSIVSMQNVMWIFYLLEKWALLATPLLCVSVCVSPLPPSSESQDPLAPRRSYEVFS